MAIDINTIKISYGRCLVSGGKRKFFDRFYDLLLSSHPDIAGKFAHTDFDKQKEALQHAISMAILYVEKKDTIAEQILRNIRISHSPKYMNITAEHYALWAKTLLQVVKEYDAKCDDNIARNWRELTEETIRYMLS